MCSVELCILLLWKEPFMKNNVRSDIILAGDLRQQLLSALHVNEQIVSQLPIESIEVYSTGFRTALKAIATAYGLNMPELREAEIFASQRMRHPSKHDMRL